MLRNWLGGREERDGEVGPSEDDDPSAEIVDESSSLRPSITRRRLIQAAGALGLLTSGSNPNDAATGTAMSEEGTTLEKARTSAGSYAQPTDKSLRITDYGAVADGGIGIGTITAGSKVVRFVDPPHDAAVGQYIKVAGAGPRSEPLVTKIEEVGGKGLTANELRIAAAATTSVTEHGVMWGTNNRDALQAALSACTAMGGGRVEIPPGGFLWDGLIDAWPPVSGNVPGDITIWGHGGASQLLITGTSTACVFYRVNSVTIDSITVRGTPSTIAVDCDQVFRFGNRRGVLRNVWFYGIAATTAIISTNRTDLVLEGGGFLGCVASQRDVIRCDLWAGVTVRETEFLDFGAMQGVIHAKASQLASYTSRSWIGIFNPQMDLSQPVGGVNGSRCINIDGARFDEGVLHHILIEPGAPNSSTEEPKRRITAVNISGCASLVLPQTFTTGFNINNVEHLTIRHCHFTAFNSNRGENTAIKLGAVREAKLERVVATTHASKIVADADCVRLYLEECDYAALEVDPAVNVKVLG